MLKFIEENIGEKSQFWDVQRFLRTESVKRKGQNDQLGFNKIKNFCSSKATFMEVKT